jgi:hypothetical protein
MTTQHRVEPTGLAGDVVATDFDGWSEEVRADFESNSDNPFVGSKLLSEDDRVRVWSIDLAPGERVGAHRHRLDYFWTTKSAGHSRQHNDDGTTRLVTYSAGETRHVAFARGDYLLHDLENVGDTPLSFLTVEHKPGTRPASNLDEPISKGAT